MFYPNLLNLVILPIGQFLFGSNFKQQMNSVNQILTKSKKDIHDQQTHAIEAREAYLCPSQTELIYTTI
jgi:hypothetical protein